MGKKGFTLIELLVVVLIIGILSAIAIPQYRRVVAKTRISEMVMFANRLHEALNEYRLVHGTYTQDLTQLIVDDLECSSLGRCTYGKFSIYINTSTNIATSYYMQIRLTKASTESFPIIETYSTKRYECLTSGYEARKEICEMFGGRTRPSSPNYYYMDNL